jgi:DNA-binding NarL/FixJ family response regulator
VIHSDAYPSKPVSAIVVSRPGILRQSLSVALTMYPWVSVVTVAGDGLNALNQVIEHQPRLLIIDSNLLDEEVEALLAAVKATQPSVRCLVFVQSHQREAKCLAAHADAVVLRSASAPQIQAVLQQLARDAVAPS